MNIVFLINSLEAGGAERVVLGFASQLSKAHRVTLVTLKNSVFYQVPEAVKHVSLSQSTRLWRGVWSLLSLPWYCHKFKHVLRQETPDVVVSFLELSNFVNILSSKNLRVLKKVSTVISVRAHSSSVYSSGVGSWLVKKLMRMFYPRADVVIANAELSRQDLIKNFGTASSKTKVVYNPFAIDQIRNLMREPLTEEHARFFKSGTIILHVGIFESRKVQEHLVHAFLILKKNIPDAKLVFVGTGSRMRLIESVVEQFGVRESVLFAGQQENVFQYMARANVFVLSSWLEGFPNALVEAMTCGTPVIATDCASGPREILAPKTPRDRVTKAVEFCEFGILVSPASTDPLVEVVSQQALARAIIDVLKKQSLSQKYATAGFERAKFFAQEKITKQFAKILQEAVHAA